MRQVLKPLILTGVVSAALLAGCSPTQQAPLASKPTESAAAVSSAGPSEREPASSQPTSSQDVSSAAGSEIPFLYDAAIMSDPPEGADSAFDAKTKLEAYLQEELAAITQPAFQYQGITEIEAEECYSIDLMSEGNTTPVRRFAVTTNGSIFELGETDAPPQLLRVGTDNMWWGEYGREDGCTLAIVNYSGQAFQFAFSGNSIESYDGVAALSPVGGRVAEFASLRFELDETGGTITVSKAHEFEHEELEKLLGSYTRQ